MGNFYTNTTLRGPSQDEVVSYLNGLGRTTYVSPVEKGCVVVFDELGDTQDTDALADLTRSLSAQFHCPAWVVLNHDDDVLWYQLYQDGALKDEYNSAPDYFDSSQGAEPGGGDAKALCAAFGAEGAEDRVEAILRDEECFFALERHADLLQALGAPDFAVGGGYRYLEGGEIPPGLDQSTLVRTGV